MSKDAEVIESIDMAIALTAAPEMTDSLRLSAINGYLQGARKRLFGKTLAVDEYPNTEWLPRP